MISTTDIGTYNASRYPSTAAVQNLKANNNPFFNIPHKLIDIFLMRLGSAEGIKNACKATYQTIDWIKQTRPVSENVQNLRQLSSDGKNVISVTEIPGKTWDVGARLVNVAKKRSLTSVAKLISSLCNLTGPVNDALKLGSDKKILNVSRETLGKATNLSSAGLVIGMPILIGNEGKALLDNYRVFNGKEGYKSRDDFIYDATGSSFKISKFTSLGILGAIGLGTAFAGLTAPAWVPLALSTNALFFSIAGDFHKYWRYA